MFMGKKCIRDSFSGRLLREVAAFVMKARGDQFLKWWLKGRDRDLDIDGYHKRISACVDAFQVTSLIDLSEWQHRYELAAASDRATMFDKLDGLSNDNARLWTMLGGICV
jgi:hypothetical protein